MLPQHFISANQLGILSVECEYYISGVNHVVNAPYVGYETLGNSEYQDNYIAVGRGQSVYIYDAGQQIDFSQGVRVRVSAPFSALNSTKLFTYCGVSATYSVSAAAYQSPYVSVFDNTDNQVSKYTVPAVNGVYPRFGTGYNTNLLLCYAEIVNATPSDMCVLEYVLHGCTTLDGSNIAIVLGDIGYDADSVATGTIPNIPHDWDSTTTTAAGGQIIVSVDNAAIQTQLQDIGGQIDGMQTQLQGIENAIVGSSVPDMQLQTITAYTIEYDYTNINEALQVLEDAPDELAGAGFWWELGYDVLHIDSPLWLIAPVLLMLAIMRYLLWRG